MQDADVIIIGAGIAGLSCAEKLATAGLRVIILEARDRLGGRILTHYDGRDGFPIELGAEFVHGESPELIQRIDQAGLRLRRVDEQPWCREADGLQKCGEFWTQTEKVLEQMRMTRRDQTFARFLRSPKVRKMGQDARDSATRYVEGFNAARANEISVNSLVRGMRAEEKIDGDKQFRIVGGYAALVIDLYKNLLDAGVAIETGTVVKQVKWKRGRVSIIAKDANGSERTFVAPRTVITLPLGVLQAGSVKFTPALRGKEAAIKRLKMGEVLRVGLRFRQRFWDDIRPAAGGATLHRMGFLFSHHPLFPTWWTQMPSQVPVMIGWSPSWHTKSMSKLSNAAIAKKAISSLAKILKMPASDLGKLLMEVHIHDWQTDKFSRGAYSYAKRGGEPAQKELSLPVQHTLFFAGEATVTDGTSGTVHGAMRSGLRVAEELQLAKSVFA